MGALFKVEKPDKSNTPKEDEQYQYLLKFSVISYDIHANTRRMVQFREQNILGNLDVTVTNSVYTPSTNLQELAHLSIQCYTRE